MVAIIDDREDVWNYSPNLVPVLPYKFFKGICDLLVRSSSFGHKLCATGLIQLIPDTFSWHFLSGTDYCMMRCTSITFPGVRRSFSVKCSSWTYSKTGGPGR